MSTRHLSSFKIRFNNKTLDYRLGEELDLNKVKLFFQNKYQVKKMWSGPRHVFGHLVSNHQNYFLKLATSKGISVVTKNEYKWNNYFKQNAPKDVSYQVPKNYDSGLYQQKYFYLITEYFEGRLLSPLNGQHGELGNLVRRIPDIIELSELIQQMPIRGEDHRSKFLSKVKNWFSDIPRDVRKEFEIEGLLNITEKGVGSLLNKPRHGDFAPWHIMELKNSSLGLVDGEHALYDSVEYYDVCYFIQRVFSVLKNPAVAEKVYCLLKEKGYNLNKLRAVLAARAIGGFLDESLIDQPDYGFANSFKNWVKQH